MDPFLIPQIIDLAGENPVKTYRQPLASGDSGAHTWEVRIVRGGAAVDLTGCTATLNVRRDGDSDEATLRKKATIAGNRVSCELPRGVYELGGKLTAVMIVEDSAGRVVTAAVLLLRGKQYITDHIADPDGTLPTVKELLQRVSAMEGTVSQLKSDLVNNTGIKMDLLWTNASPTSDFNAQTINLDSSKYVMIYIQFRFSTSDDTIVCVLANSKNTSYQAIHKGGGTIIGRALHYYADSIDFVNAMYASTVNESYMIPYKIYGIK